ncbi:hypothetical protein ES708_01015 [subsurface metagenome]
MVKLTALEGEKGREIMYYIMKKAAWDCNTGEYSSVEKVSPQSTLSQICTRVNRLPNSTRWLWTVYMYREDSRHEGGVTLTGSINAEEFEGEVPEY